MGLFNELVTELKGRVAHELLWGPVRKRRKLAETATNPSVSIFSAHPLDRPHFLSKWWDKMTDEQRAYNLIYVWKHMEIIEPFGGYEWWLYKFKELGYIPHETIEKPTEPVMIYRGCKAESKLGMSWTTDPLIAEIFAGRGRNPSARKVYTTTVSPDQILAIVDGKLEIEAGGETVYSVEYIIDYQSLNENLVKEYLC